MYNFHVFGCIIFSVILHSVNFSVKVQGLLRSDCPKACECDPERRMVSCPYGFWNEFPELPAGTNYTRISGGKFSTLRKPQACSTYRDLTFLELKAKEIGHIAEDAFQCMPALESLTISARYGSTKLCNIHRDVFNHIPNLHSLTMSLKTFRQYDYNNLCKLKKLRKISFYKNPIPLSPTFLGCFASLSEVTLGLGTISYKKLAELIQPLRNVTHRVSLTSLDLKGVRKGDFKGFKAKVLDLSHNPLTDIFPWLYDMPHLEEIDLTDNLLSFRLSCKFFRALPKLKKLILRGNSVYASNESFPECIPELAIEVLDLANNALSKVPSLPAKIWQVNLSGNKFNTLFNGSFSHLPNLLELNLSYARIGKIEQNSFYNLSNLKMLDLQGNNINESNLANLFLDLIHCPSLETLILSKNSLETCCKAFVVFKSNRLRKLYLAHCNIEQILPGTFDNFQDLQELDLSHNTLSISQDIFHNLRSLKSLFLNNNRIRYNSWEKHYEPMPNPLIIDCPLRELRLQYNHWTAVQLFNISGLKTLDLSHNNLFSFWILSYGVYMNLTINGTVHYGFAELYMCHHLTTLDLSGNLLLDPSVRRELSFDGYLTHHPPKMPQLRVLNLSQTAMGGLTFRKLKSVWHDFHQLTTLCISQSNIRILFSGMFSTLSKLIVLDASSNDIYRIEPFAFKNNSRLTELYLDNNRIKTVNWKPFQYLLRLRLLSLTNNPLQCTCEVLWILQAVKTPHLVYMNNPDQLRCFSPEDVIDTKVGDLDFSVSDCEYQWYQIMKPLGMVAFVILVLILIYITWHYRWHIRYTLFLARAGRGRYKEFHDGTEYAYDAFVAYSEKDLPWVKENLLSNVDENYIGEGGFKLCIHHRDWLGGVDIADNILKSIVESRRTIVILSKEFAASYWCRFELAMAHMQLDAEGHRKDRLLVILLGDIPTKLLTPHMKQILTTKTYLPWPRDLPYQQQFWKTLRKSLRKELLYQ